MSIFKSKKSLQFFLASSLPLAAVALIAGAVFARITLSMVDEQVQKETVSSMERLSSQVQRLLERNVSSLEDFVYLAEGTVSRTSRSEAVHALAGGLVYSRKIYYATREGPAEEGYWMDSVDWVPGSDYDWRTRGWYKASFASPGKLCYIDPYIAASTGQPCITLSKSVGGKDGSVQGVAALDMYIEDFTNFLDGCRVSPHSRIYIVTGTGLYMANDDGEKLLKANYFDEIALKTDAKGYLTADSTVIISKGHFYGVTGIGDSPWYIVADGPVSDFSRRYLLRIAGAIASLLLLSAAGAAFLSAFMGRVQRKEHTIGKKLLAETQNLVVAAKENAATSQDQSAAVKEIVATMEDNNALSESISTKIKDVSSVAGKTSGDVADGVGYLEANVQKLHEIADANQKTIDGIKSLGDKIENVWDIVSLINSVADQTKIIAFNAELEAASAGEAGKNFHIVASEIRRLADNITDSTKEIKDRITEIQQGSDSLILASESGTVKIQEGYESAKSLEERFESIKNASEITASSAGDITTIIQQQAGASEQILITLKQIAAGVENFTAATENISGASQNLKVIAGELNAQNAKLMGQEEK